MVEERRDEGIGIDPEVSTSYEINHLLFNFISYMIKSVVKMTQ